MENRVHSDLLDEAIFSTVALSEEIRTCTRCYLYRGCKQPLVGSGYPVASIMLIKECPTKVEDENGVAFCGMLALVLKQGFNRLGIDITDIYATNAIKCATRPKAAGEYQRIACLPFLKREIDIVKPAYIVAMGGSVVRTLERLSPSFEGEATFGVGRMARWSGNIHVLMTDNLSLALRSPRKRSDFWGALGSFADSNRLSVIR
jgi:DNA polymerase